VVIIYVRIFIFFVVWERKKTCLKRISAGPRTRSSPCNWSGCIILWESLIYIICVILVLFFSRVVEGWTHFGCATCPAPLARINHIWCRWWSWSSICTPGSRTRRRAIIHTYSSETRNDRSSSSLEVSVFLPFFGSLGLIIIWDLYFCFTAVITYKHAAGMSLMRRG